MRQNGQALILIIVAGAVALSVVTTATVTAIDLGKASVRSNSGQEVYFAAEAGTEEALIRMMRKNPSSLPAFQALYCPTTPETYSLNSANLTLTYDFPFGTSNGCRVIVTAQKSNTIKKVQAYGDSPGYRATKIFNILGWGEIP